MKTRFLFSLLLLLVILGMAAFTTLIHFQSMVTEIVARNPDGHNKPVETAAGRCNASDPLVYRYGACSKFINCVLDNLNTVMATDLNTGITVAGLLPTIHILLGTPSHIKKKLQKESL